MNVTVPVLILLPNTYPFFIVNLLVFAYKVHLAINLSKYRIINIISSCFLLFFHVSYWITYLFEDFIVIFPYTTLVCFGFLILGGFFQLLSLVFQNVYQLFQWIKKRLVINWEAKNQISTQIKGKDSNFDDKACRS